MGDISKRIVLLFPRMSYVYNCHLDASLACINEILQIYSAMCTIQLVHHSYNHLEAIKHIGVSGDMGVAAKSAPFLLADLVDLRSLAPNFR